MKLLVIIPAYNEAENIVNTVTALEEKCPFADYIIINDCSTDDTEQICRERGFHSITLPLNLGIGGGMQTGYRYAVENDYDIAVQFDGDGQHNAEYIGELIDPILKGEADLVIGSRFITKEGFQTSAMRRLGINLLGIALRVCAKVRISDATSGFRAASKELTRFFSENYAPDYPEPESIIAAALNGFRIREIPVIMNERVAGSSSINAVSSMYYMLKVTIAILLYRMVGKRRKEKR